MRCEANRSNEKAHEQTGTFDIRHRALAKGGGGWMGWVGFKNIFLYIRGVAHPVPVATRAKTRVQGGDAVRTLTAQMDILFQT